MENNTIRFCKYCGSPCSETDVVCPNCGKTVRFHFGAKAKITLLEILSFALAICIFSLLVMNFQLKNNLEQAQQIQGEISYKADFLDEQIAIITDENEKVYHTVSCTSLPDEFEFIAYNIEMAKFLGFSPCEICH